MSGYVLDTTVVIDHVEGYAPARAMLAQLFSETGDIFTCDVVTCEAVSRGDEDVVADRIRLLDALEYVALAPPDARWAGAQRRGNRLVGRRGLGTDVHAQLAGALEEALPWHERLPPVHVSRDQ